MKRSAKSPPSDPVRSEAAEGASTLQELGVPGALARDLEATFLAFGAVRGLDVAGFTFVALDGARHRLRVERQPPAPAVDKAA
jgi:hypothetical protein